MRTGATTIGLAGLFLASAAARAAEPRATVELLDAGAQAGLARYVERIGAAGFEVAAQGMAQSPRPRTEVFFAPGFETEARALAEVLGLSPDEVRPRTWRSPQQLTVAAAPLPPPEVERRQAAEAARKKEDEAAKAELELLGRYRSSSEPAPEGWLADAAGREIRSAGQRDRLAALLSRAFTQGPFPPALLARALERFQETLREAPAARVLPALCARFREPARGGMAERESLSRLLGHLVGREPERLAEALGCLGDDGHLRAVMLTAAVRALADRKAMLELRTAPVLTAFLELFGSPAWRRAHAYAFEGGFGCKDLACQGSDSASSIKHRSLPEGVWALSPASLSPAAALGLTRLLALEGKEWADELPAGTPSPWGPWLLEEQRAGRLELEVLLPLLARCQVDLLALRARGALDEADDARLVKAICKKLEGADDARRAEVIQALFRPAPPGEEGSWGALFSCAYHDQAHVDAWLHALAGRVDSLSPALYGEITFDWADLAAGASPPARDALLGSVRAFAQRRPGDGTPWFWAQLMEYVAADHPPEKLVEAFRRLPAASPQAQPLVLERVEGILKRRIGLIGGLDERLREQVLSELAAAAAVARGKGEGLDRQLDDLKAKVEDHVPFIFSM